MRPITAPDINHVLDLIEEHGPISPNRLVELAGLHRQTIDRYIRRAKDASLIHIGSFGPSPCAENRTVKLWVYGPGTDALRPYKSKPPKKRKPHHTPLANKHRDAIRLREERRKAEANPPIVRDPMVAALFGPSILSAQTALPTRVFKQDMTK